MGYVENNLMPNEELWLKAKIHWIVYLKGFFFVLLGLVVLSYDINTSGFLDNTNALTTVKMAVALILVLTGLFFLIKAFIFAKTTELAITSKRVIAKFGLIRRDTIELNHAQVESLMVEQGIIDRILNAGTIILQGTGGSKTPIPLIKQPLEFRREYFKVIEENK